jgi:hypothetical protein
LKLKFSRLLTCFSGVIPLVRTGDVLTPEQVVELVKLPPIQRLRHASDGATDAYSQVEELYGWFLEITNRADDELVEYLRNDEKRRDAFSRGNQFGAAIFRLMEKVGDPDRIRYVTV